jgi:hypothetical protein
VSLQGRYQNLYESSKTATSFGRLVRIDQVAGTVYWQARDATKSCLKATSSKCRHDWRLSLLSDCVNFCELLGPQCNPVYVRVHDEELREKEANKSESERIVRRVPFLRQKQSISERHSYLVLVNRTTEDVRNWEKSVLYIVREVEATDCTMCREMKIENSKIESII